MKLSLIISICAAILLAGCASMSNSPENHGPGQKPSCMEIKRQLNLTYTNVNNYETSTSRTNSRQTLLNAYHKEGCGK